MRRERFFVALILVFLLTDGADDLADFVIGARSHVLLIVGVYDLLPRIIVKDRLPSEEGQIEEAAVPGAFRVLAGVA